MRSEVIRHAKNYGELEIIKLFDSDFEVTRASRVRSEKFNTLLSVYLLKPKEHLRDPYGFQQEIMMVYSDYPSIEARTLQAAESAMYLPANSGRIDLLTYFVVSGSRDVEKWVKNYTLSKKESKIIIPIYSNDLLKNRGDNYYIRKVINKFVSLRDLFNIRLPLTSDNFFFGRKDIITSLIHSWKQNEIKGIFGLRKTGKSSVLLSLKRRLKATNTNIIWFDCQKPTIRKRRWFELLFDLCKKIAQKSNIPVKNISNSIEIAEWFDEIIKKQKKPLLLIFDEIDYITPISSTDPHWEEDYVDLWHTIRATHQEYRNFTVLVAGVNPYIVEKDTIGRVQNPLFAIGDPKFITGLSSSETSNMVRTLDGDNVY